MKKGLTKSLANATEQFESEIMQSMPWKKNKAPVEQHHFNTAKCALEKLGPDAVTALRFLKTHRRLTWGFNPPSLLPPGLTDSREQRLSIACALEGLVTPTEQVEWRRKNLRNSSHNGKCSRRTALSGLAQSRHRPSRPEHPRRRDGKHGKPEGFTFTIAGSSMHLTGAVAPRIIAGCSPHRRPGTALNLSARFEKFNVDQD